MVIEIIPNFGVYRYCKNYAGIIGLVQLELGYAENEDDMNLLDLIIHFPHR